MADYEVWHAAHNDCPPYGCGGCVVEEVDFDDDLLKWATEAAQISGESLDVFIHKAIVVGLEHERGSWS